MTEQTQVITEDEIQRIMYCKFYTGYSQNKKVLVGLHNLPTNVREHIENSWKKASVSLNLDNVARARDDGTAIRFCEKICYSEYTPDYEDKTCSIVLHSASEKTITEFLLVVS